MNSLFYDKQDRQLLSMVNAVLDRGSSSRNITTLFASHLHPRGIKEMADSSEIRVAYAVIRLLGSLEVGKADDRLKALRALRDEVLYCVENQGFAKNTARVLLEIMKHLIREGDDQNAQLRLAHDFRKAMTGKPALVRRFLARYHLMEMPESWNQVSFDHYVHDANTKGRKSPTHLIMDAWIKGIRTLVVIYYNHISPMVAKELMDAAQIMDIEIRIGIELTASFRNKSVQLIWTPRGLEGADDMMTFINKENVKAFFAEGRLVSEYQQQAVVQMFHQFNSQHRPRFQSMYDLDLEPLVFQEFTAFVGDGQMSLVHLADFIHAKLFPRIKERVDCLRASFQEADEAGKKVINDALALLNRLDTEEIFHLYLKGDESNGDLTPEAAGPLPALMQLQPAELLEKLHQLRAGNKITLSLAHLDPLDTMEMLYDCKGRITHIEVYNHKDFMKAKTRHYADIIELQRVINGGSIIALKRFILRLLEKLLDKDEPEGRARAEKFREILLHMADFQSYYRRRALRIRVGSDSAGKTNALHGMGFVVVDTIPRRNKRGINVRWPLIPVRMGVRLHKIFIPRSEMGPAVWERMGESRLGALLGSGVKIKKDWVCLNTLGRNWRLSNVAALGGRRERGNHFEIDADLRRKRFHFSHLLYLNSIIKNVLKIVMGFIPAFLTFYLTKDWWVLAYLGAPIWFAITGVRNILQSVLGGGGIRRAPLLRWSDYVSWHRVAESLLYTGFSVPLLDYLVKSVVLDRLCGITVASSPITLYTVIAVTNGIYISSHNLLRGLPRAAVIGNIFRSALSIPLALLLSESAGSILVGYEVADVAGQLQKWAAIISKSASDCVAGIIEGMADRARNILLRYRDYKTKIGQLFDSYDRMVLLFPDKDVLEMLKNPREFVRALKSEQYELLTIAAYDSLDLLYFWMYQPYARKVLRIMMRAMSSEERKIFVRFQCVLECYKPISKLFIRGLIGGNFSRSLAFYLDRSEDYLKALEHFATEKSVSGIRLKPSA